MTRAELSPRHCRPLSRSVRGQRRRQAPAPAHISRLPGRTLGDDHHKEINVGPVSDQARAAAWPGLVSSLTSSSPINLTQTRLDAFSLDHFTCPDLSGLAQFEDGGVATQGGGLGGPRHGGGPSSDVCQAQISRNRV